MTTEEYKRDNPLGAWLESKGVQLKRGMTNRCPIKDHKEQHLCVTVDIVKDVWNCNDHGQGGDIIRWMALEQGRTDAEIIKAVCGATNGSQSRVAPNAARQSASDAKATIVKIYQYHDERGREVYQVCRMEPKTFRQRHKDENDKWVWNMEDTTRVLYRLPEVLESTEVVVVEGERDADTLTELGFTATCNVGGAGKWLDGYTESLVGKDVILCGDNDDSGQRHVELVLKSIAKRVKSVKIVKVPSPHKDVTDWLGEGATDEKWQMFNALALASPPLIQGLHIPIYSLHEAELRFIKHLKDIKNFELNLGNWLPTLGLEGCHMIPGELATIIAATSAGKTYALQNIARVTAPLPTVLFELELPEELLYERFMAIHMQWGTQLIREAYSGGEALGEEGLKKLKHCYICTESGLSVDQIEKHINNAELKIGERPKVILLDYIQIIRGLSKSRRETISEAAENLKILAKTARVIIIVASQTSRPTKDDNKKIHLHSAKESGEIENSSGLVLGMWRDGEDSTSPLIVKILKNTKGRSGREITCHFKSGTGGAFTGRIEEDSKIDESDIPRPNKDP